MSWVTIILGTKVVSTKTLLQLQRLVFQMMWSEERIRELMSAARLRETNWDKQTPAERFVDNKQRYDECSEA